MNIKFLNFNLMSVGWTLFLELQVSPSDFSGMFVGLGWSPLEHCFRLNFDATADLVSIHQDQENDEDYKESKDRESWPVDMEHFLLDEGRSVLDSNVPDFGLEC